ncbi:protein of unknown function [Spirosomataceae bacterium TFI 002]|nr:protein of unknown function [Spirosomataceae bacterium TFI 002]
MLIKRNSVTVLQKYFSINWAVALLVLVMFSCNKGIQPDAPQEVYTVNVGKSERTISYLNIPLEINIKEIEKQINGSLGATLYDDNSFDNDDLKLRIDKTGNFAITSTTGENFSFEIPLSIDATKAVSVLGMKQAASTKFLMKAKFTSSYFLSSDWNFNTNTKVDGFEFITEPKITMAGFNIPIKSLVERVLVNYQPYIARQIDAQVASSVVIKPQILDLWNSLKEPILISEAYKTWLKIEPQDMLISPIRTKGNKLNINIAMKAYVDTYTGEKKLDKSQKSIDLPPLKFVSNPPAGFNINISNLLTFYEAQSIAKSYLLGHTFNFANNKYAVKVEGLEMFGTVENQMVIQLKLSGSVDGTVFLKGIPEYDKTTKTIKLANLDFDIKTKNVLLKSAAWLLEGKLEKEIARGMSFSVDDMLTQVQASVEDALSKEYIRGVKIETSTLKMVPKEVSISQEGIVSQFAAIGNIKLTIDGL